ncbi:MAG: hypothetical protein FVQ80_13450 [Planctomycetes bacterium]|nr:hypothetical protein [Planctomycetota bacterium]MBW8040891.1 hypothetical protein [Planctomycetota bacterium]
MKRFRCLVIGFSVLFLCNSVVFAENEVGFELSADYFGKYIWRGQNLDDDQVFQPAISGSYKGLTAAIWGNLELTNINGNEGDFSEVDYSLDYSADLPGIEGVGYSVGLIYYDFPGTATKDTTELYWGFNFDLPLSPSITVYHDVDEADGSYVSLAFGHSIEKIAELGPDIPVGMEIGTSLGWGSASYDKYYWGTDQSEMQDLTFSVSFPMEIAGWTLSPSINYITLLSDDIRDTDVYGTESDFFFAGISLSKSF